MRRLRALALDMPWAEEAKTEGLSPTRIALRWNALTQKPHAGQNQTRIEGNTQIRDYRRSGAWMRFIVRFLQALRRDVRVDLRGGEARVS